ncbi:MAG: ABC transporter ATP-binding protein [Oscillospiraceae bacterium]|nr:ABC transporter ATP-binding protein [Oscillospiraceae bacterium]
MEDAFLQTEGLSVGYGGVPVITGIDFAAHSGKVLTLIGPNGAGKSTILKTLIRQLSPVGGTVYLGGRDMAAMPALDMARSTAAVLTGRPAPELMSCGDVVATGRYPYTGRLGILSAEDRRIVAESMELVQVSELRDRDFERISDGQRQRVLLARAICQEPKLLIMDEPTSFLDIRHKLDFLHLLRRLVREKGIAAVLSLHELDLAQRFADTVLCVSGGRVDRVGTPEEIFQGDYVARLYGVEHGGYDALFGGVECEKVAGTPEVFVIGGGGGGIPVYRKLQRERVPFAAGVLQRSDLDYPVASALAAELFTVPPFAPVEGPALDAALARASRCSRVVCAVPAFGPLNEGNRAILDDARRRGVLEENAAQRFP